MLQCEARLLYEANRRALWTKGMVIFSFVPIVSSISQVLGKCRPSVGQVSVKYRPSVGEVSVALKSYVDRHTSGPTIKWLSTDYRLSIDRVLIECRSTVDRQLTEWRSSIDWVSTATLTKIAVDIAVNITSSKHDPYGLWAVLLCQLGPLDKCCEYFCLVLLSPVTQQTKRTDCWFSKILWHCASTVLHFKSLFNVFLTFEDFPQVLVITNKIAGFTQSSSLTFWIVTSEAC